MRYSQKVSAHRIPISKIQHGGRPPFWKSLYFHNWSELHEIWYAYTNFHPGDGNVTKFWNSQINGGWTPHWKSLFGYNASAYSPIKMKFGVIRHNHTHTKVRCNTVCTRSYLSCCNKLLTCRTRYGDILTVTTVVNAPRTVIAGFNATFVAITDNMVQPNLSFTGTVDVAHEPSDASSCMVNSSIINNNNNNSRITAIFNDNLGKPGSAHVWATSHLDTSDKLGDKWKCRKVFLLNDLMV